MHEPRRRARTSFLSALLPLVLGACSPAAAVRPGPPPAQTPSAAAPPRPSAAPPILPETIVRALASEVSGVAAKHTVQELTLFHRMRGSRGLQGAAEAILRRAREAGLAGVELLKLPADGVIFYGTQRSRPAWDADFAEIWEQRPGPGGGWVDAEQVASWETRPITLAQDSASGEAATELVDVGAGTSAKDYVGKDVRGKLVLVSSQPSAAVELAVGRLGAAGLVSYAANQRTAWWREDESLVRWGHLPTFPAPRTFAFMVSLKQARAWQQALSEGRAVRLRAKVRAGQHPGSYDIPTALVPGADPAFADQEVVLSCHLDHLRPGANDNASGCAAILEVGRTLAKLVREGKIPPPRRTLRFLFPPEVEGTIALLNARPDIPRRARAVIHMDMVGGDRSITKAVFHLTRPPGSLPTFLDDVAEELARFVNEESDRYAATGAATYPLVDPEGGKEALQAEAVDFSPGSDDEVWAEGSWRVPFIYLNDWPDRYIHTHADGVDHLDATKLLRAAFLGAAAAVALADLDSERAAALWPIVERHCLARAARALARREEVRALAGASGAAGLMAVHWASERARLGSFAPFAPLPAPTRRAAEAFLEGLEHLLDQAPAPPSPPPPDATPVYRRRPEPRGPMVGFGYGYLEDQLARRGLPEPALPKHRGLYGDGEVVAYEALNLVDGHRSLHEIWGMLSALYGPVPIEAVAEYLHALEQIEVLDRVGAPP
jgi:aminopeptidase YwaD